MDRQISSLVVIIVVVTVALFLVGLVWRLYHAAGHDPNHRSYDRNRD